MMLIAVLHSLLFLWCWLLFFIHYFSTPSLTVLWAIARFLHPFYFFSPAHRREIHNTFISTFPGPSFTVLPRALWFWKGIFYPQAFFTLHSFPHFWHNLLLSRSPWEPVDLPWCLQGFMLILKTQTRSICLFDSQQSTTLIFRKIPFKSYQILLWITCGKKFSLSAPYSFRTLFAFSKSNVKTNKKHFEQCLYCL